MLNNEYNNAWQTCLSRFKISMFPLATAKIPTAATPPNSPGVMSGGNMSPIHPPTAPIAPNAKPVL